MTVYVLNQLDKLKNNLGKEFHWQMQIMTLNRLCLSLFSVPVTESLRLDALNEQRFTRLMLLETGKSKFRQPYLVRASCCFNSQWKTEEQWVHVKGAIPKGSLALQQPVPEVTSSIP
jgi:hypothetical protein